MHLLYTTSIHTLLIVPQNTDSKHLKKLNTIIEWFPQ